MGMFDTIKANGIVCKQCEKPLEDFQSKNGPCILNVYEDIDEFLSDIKVGQARIYTDCQHCGFWNEYLVSNHYFCEFCEHYHNEKEGCDD